MLRTRLWMGAVLVALAVGVLVADQWLAPWFPFLFLLLSVLAAIACHELLLLIPEARRPAPGICYTGVLVLLVFNWLPHLKPQLGGTWSWVAGIFAALVLGAFLVEMANFQAPGESINRIALTVWLVAYLGLLPSFLAQIRRLEEPAGTYGLALAIFVPKCCDIGAYFTGRLLGRHPMAPVLSPKKTWEGAAGGIATAALVAVAINRLSPAPLLSGLLAEVGCGVTVGGAGMLGDLAESLIKRDCQTKDASQAVPGFGGVLDVVDAVIFAAPVAYWWLIG